VMNILSYTQAVDIININLKYLIITSNFK